jgi:hypothetical protein
MKRQIKALEKTTISPAGIGNTHPFAQIIRLLAFITPTPAKRQQFKETDFLILQPGNHVKLF